MVNLNILFLMDDFRQLNIVIFIPKLVMCIYEVNFFMLITLFFINLFICFYLYFMVCSFSFFSYLFIHKYHTIIYLLLLILLIGINPYILQDPFLFIYLIV
jgi:hypothetical protein